MARCSLLFCLLALLACVSASPNVSNSTGLPSQLSTLPQCALACVNSLAGSTCPGQEQHCLCSAVYPLDYFSLTQQCIASNCTVRDEFDTQKIFQTFCDRPPRDAGPSVLGVVTTFAALAFMLCIARLAVRATDWGLLGLDDAFIALAMLLSFVLLVATYFQVHAGLAHDAWAVNYDDHYTMFLWIWISQILYVCCVYLTKLSILCFYLRVFVEQGLARQTYVLLGLTAVCFVVVLFLSIFQCSPVSYVWTSWDRVHQGHCLPLSATMYLNAVPNIALDCLVLALPLPTLLRLNLDTGKKIGLLIVFSLGIFTTIVSIVRLQTLLRASKDVLNLTYTLRLSASWSLVEVYVGIICVCLPALRAFFRNVRESLYGRSRHYEKYGDGSDCASPRQRARAGSESFSAPGEQTEGSDRADDIDLVDFLQTTPKNGR